LVCRETVSSTASGHVDKSRNKSSRTLRGISVAVLSAVESKPASDGRIKTSHFFTFKSVGDVLARNDLTVSE